MKNLQYAKTSSTCSLFILETKRGMEKAWKRTSRKIIISRGQNPEHFVNLVSNT